MMAKPSRATSSSMRAGHGRANCAGWRRTAFVFFRCADKSSASRRGPVPFEPSLFSTRGILVPRRDGRLLAGSVFEEAGFNKTLTLGGMTHILRAATELVPSLSELPFREAWAGLRPATDDLLPVIGASPSIPNVFYACGHFRSGILLSSLTGEVIADLIKGRAPKIDLAPFASGSVFKTASRRRRSKSNRSYRLNDVDHRARIGS